MIDINIAKTLKGGTELRHKTLKNADGVSAVRCRVNGKCKTWKTKLTDFKLPVKYGLKECFYITPENGAEWETV